MRYGKNIFVFPYCNFLLGSVYDAFSRFRDVFTHKRIKKTKNSERKDIEEVKLLFSLIKSIPETG